MNKSKLGEELRDKIENLVTYAYVDVLHRDDLYEHIRYGGIPNISELSDIELLDMMEMCCCIDVDNLSKDDEADVLYLEATSQLEVEKMLNE